MAIATDFVTCDLLDNHSDKIISVVSPSIDGKRFRNFDGHHSFGSQGWPDRCDDLIVSDEPLI